MRENKSVLRVGIIFGIVLIWSFFIISLASGGSDFNIPIYIQTSAGIEKANYDNLVEILFNHDFEIEKKTEVVSDEKCSLNAEAGNLEIDGKRFDKNDLSFYIPLKNSGSGQGSLITQKDRNRFSLSFEVQEILKTDSEKLIFKASGKGRLNQEELIFDEIIINFDKINNIVNITGIGDKNFEAKALKISSIEGCSSREQEFYFLMDKGNLGKGRSAEEVVKILNEYPEFRDVYWNLEKIHKPYWWIHIPTLLVDTYS